MNAECRVLYVEGMRGKGPYVCVRRWQSSEQNGMLDVVIEYGDSQAHKTELLQPAVDSEIIRQAIAVYDRCKTGEATFDERVEQAEEKRKENEWKPDPPPAPALKQQASQVNQTPGEFLAFVADACEKQKGKAAKPFFDFLKNKGTQAMIEQLKTWGYTEFPAPNGTESNPLQRVEDLIEAVLSLDASPGEVDTLLMRICGTTNAKEIAAIDLPKAQLALSQKKIELEANIDALHA